MVVHPQRSLCLSLFHFSGLVLRVFRSRCPILTQKFENLLGLEHWIVFTKLFQMSCLVLLEHIHLALVMPRDRSSNY